MHTHAPHTHKHAHKHTSTHAHTHTHTAIDTSVKNVIVDFGNRCASAGPCMKMILGGGYVFLSFCWIDCIQSGEQEKGFYLFTSQILFSPSALYSDYSSDLLFDLFFMCFPSICYSQGALCSFGEVIQTHNSNIFNINEVILQTQKYSSFP